MNDRDDHIDDTTHPATPMTGAPPLEDRIRRELQGRARAIATAGGAGLAGVTRAAERRARRARVAGAATAVALIAGAGAAAIVVSSSGDDDIVATAPGTDTPDPAADTGANGSDPGATTGTDLDGGDVSSPAYGDPGGVTTGGGAEPGSDDETVTDLGTGPDGRTDDIAAPTGPRRRTPVIDVAVVGDRAVAITAAGEVAVGGTGGSLTSIVAPTGQSDDVAVDLVEHDGVVHVVGTGEDGWWLRRSTDLRRWTDIALPDAGAVASDDLIEPSSTRPAVGAGPDGVIVTGEVEHRLRIEAILPADVIASGAFTIGDPTGRAVVVVYDPVSGDVVDEIDLADLGLDDATIRRILDGGTSSHLAVAGRRGRILDRSDDLPDRVALGSPAASPAGWFAIGYSDDFGEPVLWRSGTGRRWRPLPLSAPAGDAGPAVVEAGDRLLVITAEGPLLTAQWSDDGSAWTETDLAEAFPAETTGFSVVAIDGGPTGVAALVTTTGSTGPEPWIVTSTDGSEWNARRLAEVTPPRITRTAGAVAVVPDGVVVAAAGRTTLVEAAAITG